MSNLADLIEEFILRKLAAECKDIVVLRRNELADEIDCAPSQISYVLNTRFTTARGFTVESRRGLGGFVRIARVVQQTTIYEEAARQIHEETPPEDIYATLEYWRSQGLLSGRETALLGQMCQFAYALCTPPERTEILRRLFITISEYS